MKFKTELDEYLYDNFNRIRNERSSNIKFRWSDERDRFKRETGIIVDGEFIRGKFRNLEKQNRVSKKIDDLKEEFKEAIDSHYSFAENLDKGTATLNFTAQNTPTEDEIIEWFHIDTKKYKINQIYHKTTPGGKYFITVSLLAIKGIESLDYINKFEKFVESYNRKILSNNISDIKPKEILLKDRMCIISLADLHIGNYQKNNYVNLIKQKVISIIDNISSTMIEKLVILNTGDMIHADSSKEQTWKGTQLHSQDLYEDTFVQALDLITDILDYSKKVSMNITFVNVRGNHSFDSEYCIGEALRRIYKNDKSIEILNSKDTRIYYYWNNNGFLFTHGDKALDRLPLIFATEGKDVFSKAEHNHILLGHLHHSKSKQFTSDTGEFVGIEVRVLGSPTSNDIWHKQEGFVQNNKKITCLLYTPDEGKQGEFSFRI